MLDFCHDQARKKTMKSAAGPVREITEAEMDDAIAWAMRNRRTNPMRRFTTCSARTSAR